MVCGRLAEFVLAFRENMSQMEGLLEVPAWWGREVARRASCAPLSWASTNSARRRQTNAPLTLLPFELIVKRVSTPEQKCIGWPERKYISRPGSHSCDLDGMAWHRPAVPVSHHDRARAARGQHSASPYPPRSRLSKGMYSLAACQSGHGQVSHARQSFPAHPGRIKWNVFLPVSMPIVLTATALVF